MTRLIARFFGSTELTRKGAEFFNSILSFVQRQSAVEALWFHIPVNMSAFQYS